MENKNQKRNEMRRLVESMAREFENKHENFKVSGGMVVDLKNGTVDSFGEKVPKDIFNEILKKTGVKMNQREEAKDQTQSSVKETKEPNQEAREFAKFVVNKLRDSFGKAAQDTKKSDHTNEEHDANTCPNCSQYMNFEEQYKGVPGRFDYAEVELGDKVFGLKYFMSDEGEEIVVMRDITEYEDEDDSIDLSKLSLEELQNGLNLAVQAREFDKAQEILNAISNIKSRA